MAVVWAGEGGAVLVAAARASEPPAFLLLENLAHAGLAPRNVEAHPIAGAPVPRDVHHVELVDGEEATRDAVRAWAASHGLEVRMHHVDPLPSPAGVRVVAVSAASTGSGKTGVTRRVARLLRRSGVAVAVARHPDPNLLLWEGRAATTVVRSPADAGGPRPLEEWEELAPVVGTGAPMVCGLDPVAVLRAAAGAAGPGGVVVWDGGGSATPWVRAHLHIVVVDLLREVPSTAERRIDDADVVILTKADTAAADLAREREARVRAWNPGVPILAMDMPPAVADSHELKGRRVVVVEDAPSLLLGGLSAGAAALAARRFRCGVVNPRPFAVGAVKQALADHPHVGAVIPSLGRTPREIDDFVATVRATPGDAILWASPATPETLLGDEDRRIFRTYGEPIEVAGGSLQDVITTSLFGDA